MLYFTIHSLQVFQQRNNVCTADILLPHIIQLKKHFIFINNFFITKILTGKKRYAISTLIIFAEVILNEYIA